MARPELLWVYRSWRAEPCFTSVLDYTHLDLAWTIRIALLYCLANIAILQRFVYMWHNYLPRLFYKPDLKESCSGAYIQTPADRRFVGPGGRPFRGQTEGSDRLNLPQCWRCSWDRCLGTPHPVWTITWHGSLGTCKHIRVYCLGQPTILNYICRSIDIHFCMHTLFPPFFNLILGFGAAPSVYRAVWNKLFQLLSLIIHFSL